MTYVVFKKVSTFSKTLVPAGNKKFSSYEAARQACRRWIRKTNTSFHDFFWTSNPMIGDYGYTIRNVNSK